MREAIDRVMQAYTMIANLTPIRPKPQEKGLQHIWPG